MYNGHSASPPSVGDSIAQARMRRASARASESTLAVATAFRIDAYEGALYFVMTMVGGYAFLLDNEFSAIANTGVPALLIVALGWGCVRMAIQQVETILTPTFVMRVAILFYAGVGSLIPIYANGETMTYLENFFNFSDQELLKYNLTNVAFVIFFSYSTFLFRWVTFGLSSSGLLTKKVFAIEPSALSMPVVSFAFLAVGATFKYLVIIPFQFGLIGGTYPQIVAQIALLEHVGIFLSLIWALRHRPSFATPLVAYGIACSMIGILTFSKTEVFLPIVMMLAATVYVRPTVVKIVFAIFAILFVYNFAQPVASHGRAWLIRCCDGISAPAGFSERVDIIWNYFNGNAITQDDNVDYALARFSHANIGTFVVSARDGGWQGDTLKNAAVVLVPRILWEEKPKVTDIARDLNVAITGNYFSSTSPGFAAEGYWDGGWLGTCLMGSVVGLVCYLWSLYTLEVQKVGAWHLFAIVLMGIRVGFRFDGFFVVDVIGPLGLAIAGHVIIMLLNRTLAPRD